MPKNKLVRRIDLAPSVNVGGSEIITSAENIAPPIPAAIPEPRNLVATQGPIAQSAVTPSAYIDLTWQPPITPLDGLRYIIEYDTSSAFTSPQRQNTANLTARLTLPTRGASGITYYFRIATLYNSYQQSDWSDTASATTVSDTAAPTPPTGVTASYIGQGDLRILWAKSTSDNLRDTVINIYDSASKTTLYETVSVDGEQFVWTVAQNRNRTSNVPRTSVYVELQSRSWGGTFSTAVSATATSAAPSAPTVSVDFTGPDAIFTISYGADVASLSFVPDTSVAARVIAPSTRYVYTYANNAADHSGTADPILTYSFTATNGLGQSSTATSGTATNAAPSAPSSVAVSGFLGTMSISVSATQPSDFKTFRVRVIQTLPSAADVTFDSANTLITRSIDTLATYQVGVKVVDVFNQSSAETLSTTAIIDALTITQLRSETQYRDQTGALLNATNSLSLRDGLWTSGINYNQSSAGAWEKSITAERPLIERYRDISVGTAISAAQNVFGYFGLSSDNTTWRWFSGPYSTVGSNVYVLTEVGNEVLAQASPVLMDVASIRKISLPSIVEARFIKFGFTSNSTATYAIREFYPRRLVQSDDIEAESIKAINIAAGAVTAAKLSVSQLSAITADMGTLTAGTITGATVQTASSGARAVMNSSGLTTYNSSGVAQVTAGTGSNGALTAGAGMVRLDALGITLTGDTSITSGSRLKVKSADGNDIGYYAGWLATVDAINFYNYTGLRAFKNAASGYGGTISLFAEGATHNASISIRGNSPGSAGVDIDAGVSGTVDISGATVQTKELTLTAASATEGGQVVLKRGTSGSVDWLVDVSADNYRVFDNGGNVRLQFAPGARPSVTGSRGGNAALTNLITALAGLNLITNSTSA